jgi:hypothetical protein
MDEPTCSEDGCDKPVASRGKCQAHYMQMLRKSRKTGIPLPPIIRRRRRNGLTDEERFLVKVRKDGPVPAHRPELGPCWVWTGAKMGSGYGVFYLNSQNVGAHRATWELHVGPIPDGLEPDHLCHPSDGSCLKGKKCPHRLCVNPAHLEPVTRRENVRRSTSLSAKNMAKTHCDRGHEFTPENTYVKVLPDGRESRQCHACRRLSKSFKGDADAPVVRNEVKTHCPKGHAYDEENTCLSPQGSRMCRICRRDQWRAWRDRQK